MAHITDLRLEGLQNRENTIELALHRDVNVFFGENGCGKTTVLNILTSAMSRDGGAMVQLPIAKAEVGIFSIERGHKIRHSWIERKSRNARLKDLSLDLLREAEFSPAAQRNIRRLTERASQWKTDPEDESGYWDHRFLSTARLYTFDDDRPGYSRLTEERLNKKFTQLVNNSWLVFNSATLTRVRQIQEVALQRVLGSALADTLPPPPPARTEDTHTKFNLVRQFLKRQDGLASVLGPEGNFAERYAGEPVLRAAVDILSEVESEIQNVMQPLEKFSDTIAKLFSTDKQIRPTERGLEVELEGGEKISTADPLLGRKTPPFDPLNGAYRRTKRSDHRRARAVDAHRLAAQPC